MHSNFTKYPTFSSQVQIDKPSVIGEPPSFLAKAKIDRISAFSEPNSSFRSNLMGPISIAKQSSIKK